MAWRHGSTGSVSKAGAIAVVLGCCLMLGVGDPARADPAPTPGCVFTGGAFTCGGSVPPDVQPGNPAPPAPPAQTDQPTPSPPSDPATPAPSSPATPSPSDPAPDRTETPATPEEDPGSGAIDAAIAISIGAGVIIAGIAAYVVWRRRSRSDGSAG